MCFKRITNEKMRLGPRGTEDTIKLPGTVFTADDNPANHIALIEISHVLY